MPNPPETTIVIVTHRRPESLRETLSSLAAARFPVAVVEALVIENGDSASGSREVAAAARLPVSVRWLFLADSRLSAARNFGVANARGEFVIIHDDDIWIGPDSLDAYVVAAAELGPGHFFGGPLVPRYDVPPPDWLYPYLPHSARGWTLGSERRIIDQPAFLGSNHGAFRVDFEAVGGYPEYLGPGQRYRLAGEETYLQQRMLDRGMKGVFLPRAAIEHYVPVERCSPHFALERFRQYQVVCEIARHIENRIKPSRFPPRWVWRRLLVSTVTAMWKRAAVHDIRARFDSELELCTARAPFLARSIMARYDLYDEFCADGQPGKKPDTSFPASSAT